MAGAASDEHFVEIRLHRTVVKTTRKRGKVSTEPVIEDLPFTSVLGKRTNRILITGDAGSGKTTSLLRLAYTTAKRGLEQPERYSIPVLLRSLDLYNANPTSLLEHCDQHCRQLTGLDKATFSDDDLANGRVIVLVDSLDELPSNAARECVLGLVDAMGQQFPQTKFVLTSRYYQFVDQLPSLRRFDHYRISPIGWRQAEKLLVALKKGEIVPGSQSKELMRRLERLHGVELNPLLVAVFAASTDVAKQDIPANITELFKKYTELMLGRWDDAKGIQQQFQAPLKDFILTQLAYRMHVEKSVSMERSDADNFIRGHLKSLGHAEAADALLVELFERSGLFRIDRDHIEFRHLMIQEFFAGRGISSVDEASRLIVDEWWKRPLVFYFGEHPDRISSLQGILRAVTTTDPEERIVAATTVGLSLQACYLSPVVEKLTVWKWVVDALSIEKSRFFEMVDPSNERPITTFIHYCLCCRDAVALGHLREHLDSMLPWINEADLVDPTGELNDLRKFWFVAALIESGSISAAEKVMSLLRPSDTRLLLGLHLGAYLTAKVRPASASDKEKCEKICKKLVPSLVSLREQLTKELNSILLEWKDGKPQAVDPADASTDLGKIEWHPEERAED